MEAGMMVSQMELENTCFLMVHIIKGKALKEFYKEMD